MPVKNSNFHLVEVPIIWAVNTGAHIDNSHKANKKENPFGINISTAACER